MSERWLVVGGGVGGIAGAYLLARAGHAVRLVEPAEELGRASRSIRWHDFELDMGCHVFGNDAPRTTRILLALLEGNAYAVHGQPASISGGRLCAGTELPDESACGDAGLEALRAAAERGGATGDSGDLDLASWLRARYGEPVGDALAARTRKMWRVAAEALGAEARHAGPFRRARVVGDERARALKRDPALDDRIAARPAAGEAAPAGTEGIATRSLYPASGSMGGFSRSATRVLEKAGVALELGRGVERLLPRASGATLTLEGGSELAADRVLWTGGLAELERCAFGTRELASASHRVPMTLYWFAVPAAAQSPWTWVHDWDEDDLLFRASLPARYGARPRRDGRAVLCCEVPTRTDEAAWTQPETTARRVFDEARRHGIVGAEGELLHWRRLPTTYRLPLARYAPAARALRESLASGGPLCLPDEWRFGSSAAIAEVERTLTQAGGI